MINTKVQLSSHEIESSFFSFVELGDIAAVEHILMNKLCAVDIVNDKGEQPIHNAVPIGNPDMVKLLIKYGADVNARYPSGEYLLHYAAATGIYSVLRELLNNGANPNILSNDGDTPLHIAAMLGHVEVIKILIHARANVNARNNAGDTPIINAGAQCHSFPCDVLYSYGADPNIKGAFGMNPLHRAMIGFPNANLDTLYSFAKPVTPNHPAVLAFMESWDPSEVDINAVTERGMNCLALASEYGHVDCVNYFLKKGFKIDATDKMNQTALHYAAFSGHPEVVKVLLANKASLNIKSSQMQTPLHLCAAGGNVECMRLFADVIVGQKDLINAKDQDGNTALHWACRRNVESVEILLKLGAEVNAKNDEESKNSPPFPEEAGEALEENLYEITLDDEYDQEGEGVEDDDALEDEAEEVEYEGYVTEGAGITEEHLKIKEGVIGEPTKVQEILDQRSEVLKISSEVIYNEKGRELLMRAYAYSYLYGDDDLMDENEKKDMDMLTADREAIKHNFLVTNGEEGKWKLTSASKEELKKVPLDSYYSTEFQSLVKNMSPESLPGSAHVGNLKFKKLFDVDLKRKEIIEMLVKHGADLSIVEDCGHSIVAAAATYSLYHVIQYLLENKDTLKISLVGEEKCFSAIARAYNNNCQRLIELLYEYGDKFTKADKLWLIHLTNVSSPSLLLRALREAEIDVNTLLLWNMKVRIPNHYLVLDLHNESDNSTEIISYYCPITLLMRYTRKKLPHTVKALLEAGADPLIITDIGTTVLHDAAYANNLEILKMLLPKCLSLINHQDIRGFSPLFLAAQNGSIKTITALCEAGADLTLRCNQGRTVLHYVVLSKSLEALEYLYHRCPTNISILDNYKSSILHICVSEGGTEKCIMFLLATSRFSLEQKDRWDLTAVDVATRARRDSIVSLLQRKSRSN